MLLQEDGHVEGETDGAIQEACLQKFSSRDYIMEPAIFSTLKMYACVSKSNNLNLYLHNFPYGALDLYDCFKILCSLES